jgi:hypothetical protein
MDSQTTKHHVYIIERGGVERGGVERGATRSIALSACLIVEFETMRGRH